MARLETIKSFVYLAYREGLNAEQTLQATQARFPHKAVSWNYVLRIRRHIAHGDKVADALAGAIGERRSCL